MLRQYDDDMQIFWAPGVTKKGVSEQVVPYSVGTLDKSEYQGEEITFKTDQEPSILALKQAVCSARLGRQCR